VIFGIFGNVAVRARRLDRLDDRRALLVAQPRQLVPELAVALFQHRHLFGTRHGKTLFNPFQNLPLRGSSPRREANCQ
jgi:hypothetical protein